MSVRLRMRLDGSGTRFNPVPLSHDCLAIARRHATRAQNRVSERAAAAWSRLGPALTRLLGPLGGFLPGDLRAERAEACLHALLYAALAVEAHANEIGEDAIAPEHFADFERKSPVKKWQALYALRGVALNPDADEPLRALATLTRDRNLVAHYKLTPNADRAVYAPRPVNPSGRWVVWSADIAPDEIIPSPMRRLFEPDVARGHVEAADAVFRRWREVSANTSTR